MYDCLFCKIIRGDVPSHKIYEDEHVYAFLDINPVNPGHTLVVPKQHTENLYDVPDENLCRVMSVVKKLSMVIKQALVADGINIEMNNDTSAGQVVFHTHIHIIPRFKNDGLRHWPGQPSDKSELEAVKEKIKKAL